MAVQVVAANIIKTIPTQLLIAKVSDENIALLAFDMQGWEEYAPLLGLNQSNVDDIKSDNKGLVLQAQKSLFQWREMQAIKATNHRLIVILCSARKADLAQKLCRLLLHLPDDSASQQDILDSFQSYLKELYSASDSFKHPSLTQWPFSAIQSYIDLSLFDVPIKDDPPEDERKQKEKDKPVKLENIFLAGNRQAKRKVLILEGVAGAGKTTLSWHSCKKWAAGELFKHIRLLIHMSLNDPDIASASCLADIIPHSDEEFRRAVAKAIQKKDGMGVCFLFDACDEFSGSWGQKSFLYRFIAGKGQSTLNECSILMTARPEIHHTFSLAPLLTARVRTTGFERVKLVEFLDASLSENQPELRKEVAKTFKVNPELLGLCSLPLNVTILVHLYNHLKDSLPKTTTGLFKPLVSNLLVRHIEHKENKCPEIREFSDIPEAYLPKFTAVCKLAFLAFEQHSRIIGKDMLKKCGLNDSVDAMGFLQLHQQLTAYGCNHRYSFLHLQLQEFLAAVHIAKMKDHEQVETIQKILRTAPLSAVLPFFAGLTSLSNKAVLDTLMQVMKNPLDTISILQDLAKDPQQSNDRRLTLLALLNSIYETQRPELCESAIPKASALTKDLILQLFSLAGLGLIPLDCLSVGYFIGNRTNTVFTLQNYVSETALSVLVKQLRLCHNTRREPPTNILTITPHNLSADAAKVLKDLIQHTSVHVLSLLMVSTVALKNVIEGIYHSMSTDKYSRSVSLNCPQPCHFNHIIVLMMCPKLYSLEIFGFKLNDDMTMNLMMKAIESSKIGILRLIEAEIDDNGLDHLGDAICNHEFLETFDIAGNCFSSKALAVLLTKLVGGNSLLQKLFLDSDFTLDKGQIKTVEMINDMRRGFYPPLKVVNKPKALTSTLNQLRNRNSAINKLPPKLVLKDRT